MMSPRIILSCILISIVSLLSVMTHSPTLWYVFAALLGAFGFIVLLTQKKADRMIYVTCSGLILVIAVSELDVWLGLVIAWILGSMILDSLDLMSTIHDVRIFLVYSVAIGVMGLGTDLINNPLIPLFLAGISTLLLFLFMLARESRLRKEYSGEPE